LRDSGGAALGKLLVIFRGAGAIRMPGHFDDGSQQPQGSRSNPPTDQGVYGEA
jgi:hypothetical protein